MAWPARLTPHPLEHGAYSAEALTLFIVARSVCDIEHGECLSRRALGNSKVVLSRFSPSGASFGDIEHNGVGGPNSLVPQVCHTSWPFCLVHP